MKSLKTISWDVSEETYRQDSALSYSTLAKYERGGFNSIPTLFDKVESPSLLFGSLVDTLITGTPEEFDSRFFVCDFPDIPDSIITIVKHLYNEYGNIHNDLSLINDKLIINATDVYKYQPNWKPETRAKVIKEKGEEYYNLLFLAGDKTIVSTNDYNDAVNAYNALKDSESTKFYFMPDNPFDGIERCYQLKFKATLNNVDYRCMFDLILVDTKNKTIQPIDLKTSFKKEYDFYKSFMEWSYNIQCGLYVRILEAVIKNDEYFKDFTILPYKDIVVCRTSLTPLVWDFEDTFVEGELVYGKNKQIVLRDPQTIGEELKYYLDLGATMPKDINKDTSNSLYKWLNTL
jgi:hypothetical protein